MEQIASALLIWIAMNSAYPAAGLRPPPIVLLEPAAMAALARGESFDGASQSPPTADANIWGHYRWDAGPSGTIYIVRPEDTAGAARYAQPSDNPVFRERLLHELVHFAQRQTGAYERFLCRAQGEHDAYRLGGRYLHEQGVGDPLPNRRFVAFVQSSC